MRKKINKGHTAVARETSLLVPSTGSALGTAGLIYIQRTEFLSKFLHSETFCTLLQTKQGDAF